MTVPLWTSTHTQNNLKDPKEKIDLLKMNQHLRCWSPLEQNLQGEEEGREQPGRVPELVVGDGRLVGLTGKLTTEAGQGRTRSEPGIQAQKNRWKVVYSTE